MLRYVGKTLVAMLFHAPEVVAIQNVCIIIWMLPIANGEKIAAGPPTQE